MTRSLVELKGLLAAMEFPFLQVKIDSKFRHGLSHHFKEEFPTLHKVTLLFSVDRDLHRSIHKGLEAFKMVWMGMGQDDKINLFWRYPISFHLMKEIGDVTGMTWIDEDRYFTMDQIGVAVIFVNILPKVGIEVFFKFHPIKLLRAFSTPVCSFSSSIK